MNLSKRLRMNVSLVPQGSRVADIGCDHGYASIWLVREGVAEKVIAMDIGSGPIQRARKHIEDAGFSDRIECRQSNGTEKLVPGEVDTLMIAGMGGPLMTEILRNGRDVLEQVTTLVLQPQSELREVRRFLVENEFAAAEEKACLDGGKYYFAIKAVKQAGREKKTVREDWQMRYGTYLVETGNDVMRQYLMKERETYQKILRNPALKTSNRETREKLAHRIEEIEYCLALMPKERQEKRKKTAGQERRGYRWK